MIMRGHVHDGVVVLDDAVELPEGIAVRIEVLLPPNHELSRARRQGGQWRGEVQLANDFDVLPDDFAEAFGMKSSP